MKAQGKYGGWGILGLMLLAQVVVSVIEETRKPTKEKS